MAKWIIVSSFIIAGIILGFIYKELFMTPQVSESPIRQEEQAINIVHAFKDGVHRYSGEIRLPHSCYSVKIDARADPPYTKKVFLKISTRDNMIDLALCFNIATSYQFEAVVEAPEHATPALFINEKETPLRIIESQWQSPKGTFLNLENI